MSTMTRTDIHRPSAVEFDPENYEVFGFADFHETDGYRPVQVVSALVNEGWSFRGAPHGSGQCSHCGARLRYAALMGHTPTKTLLYVGETCLDNRFAMTAAEFQRMRKEGALNAERRSRRDRVQEIVNEHPDLVWASYAHNIEVVGGEVEWTTAASYGEHMFATEAEAQAWIDQQPQQPGGGDYPIYSYKRGTTWGEKARQDFAIRTLSDIWFKVEKYGQISDKQALFVSRLVSQLTEAQTRLEQREAEQAAKAARGATVVAGRQVIEGEVTTTKWVENAYGGSLKMRVVNGDLAYWGTVPSSLDVEKGARVRFTATVQPSGDDPSFGFFKRPTKAEIL